jgi:hypothetical protein
MKSDRSRDLIALDLFYYEFEQFISIFELRISDKSTEGATVDPVLQAIYDKKFPRTKKCRKNYKLSY